MLPFFRITLPVLRWTHTQKKEVNAPRSPLIQPCVKQMHFDSFETLFKMYHEQLAQYNELSKSATIFIIDDSSVVRRIKKKASEGSIFCFIGLAYSKCRQS